MKFDIYRTSSCLGSEKPCEGAVKDEARSNNYFTTYTIEINSLEELIALKEEVGDIIIADNDDNQVIEIYDDYRE